MPAPALESKRRQNALRVLSRCVEVIQYSCVKNAPAG